MKQTYKTLIIAAKKALRNSYAPYSRLKVGAAVLGGSGRIYTGVNVENASYGLTVCAERVALYKAVSEGEKSVKAVAVVSSPGKRIIPCGACLQVIAEFGPGADIITLSAKGFSPVKLTKFLPRAFKFTPAGGRKY